MADSPTRDIFFSFFMFTADMKPADAEYAKGTVRHMTALLDMGYTGFDLPVAPPAQDSNFAAEIDSYAKFRDTVDAAGLKEVKLSTNVGATPTFDPTSPDSKTRDAALEYLKSRVDITAALRGSLLAGPIVMPYGLFPKDDAGQPLWSDALADWLPQRYANAQPVIQELGEYAAKKKVQLAIEPVDHWETAAPNITNDVTRFLRNVSSSQVGACVDSAHVVLGSEGPQAFSRSLAELSASRRVHAVHVSAPDRGLLHDSWIPWNEFLRAVLQAYDGPLLIEVFNAIPIFLGLLRLTRRKFGIPGEDAPKAGTPDAYTVARDALAMLRWRLANL